MSKQQKDEML